MSIAPIARLGFVVFLVVPAWGQEGAPSAAAPASKPTPVKVNWLYGAYIPKDASFVPLTNRQRAQLYAHETFTGPSTYAKTLFSTVADQISNSPTEWRRTTSGFGRRFASRYGELAIQNSLSAAGNALLQYEPRYDRCPCTSFWPRARHALVRNFVTYNKTEKELRPQFASYGAALGAGMIASTWRPGDRAWAEGFRSMLTRAGGGCLSNLFGEFAPEILRHIKKP